MPDQSLQFEHTIQLVDGKRGHQTAQEKANLTTRRKRLRDLCKTFTRQVVELDTTTRHRERILHELVTCEGLLKERNGDPWEVVYCLFGLVARLLGYDYAGVRPYTPAYFQNKDQRFTTTLFETAEGSEHFQVLTKNAMTIRREIVRDLKGRGVDDFTISLALSTTEHAVKKLHRGL